MTLAMALDSSFKNIAKGGLSSIKNVATMIGKMVRIFADMGKSMAMWKIGLFAAAFVATSIELVIDGSYAVHSSGVLGLTLMMWIKN